MADSNCSRPKPCAQVAATSSDTSEQVTGTPPDSSPAWSRRAEELTSWAWERLVNRVDIWGAYHALNKRTGPRMDRSGNPVLRDGQPVIGPRLSYTGNRRGGKPWVPNTPFTPEMVLAHFRGGDGSCRGVHAISLEGGWCRWGCIDIDAHGPEASAAKNLAYALMLGAMLREMGFTVLLEDSNGKGGYHVWCLFQEPLPSHDVHNLLKYVTRGWAVPAWGQAMAPEVNPKQRDLRVRREGEPVRCGNFVRLPGRHHTRAHWSRFWDFTAEAWLAGEAAVEHLLGTVASAQRVPARVAEVLQVEAVQEARTRARVRSPGVSPGSSRGRGIGPDDDPERRVEDLRAALGFLGVGWVDQEWPWCKVGMALKGLGDPGLDLWQEWSYRCAEKYDWEECEERWDRFRDEPLTYKSVFKWASDEGWKNPGRREAKGGQVKATPKSASHVHSNGQGGAPAPREEQELAWEEVERALHLLPREWLEDEAARDRVGTALKGLGEPGLVHWGAWLNGSEWWLKAPKAYQARWKTLEVGDALQVLVWAAEAMEARARSNGNQEPVSAAGAGGGLCVGPYATEGGVIVRWERGKDEPAFVALSNFDARIVEDLTSMTATGVEKLFKIVATQDTGSGAKDTRVIEVKAKEFLEMGWVIQVLGAAWNVTSGPRYKDQLREAIQLLSRRDGIAQHTVYKHTGWVRVRDRDYYLHAGGAIGAEGCVTDIRVGLSNLAEYELPAPVVGDELVECVVASLDILKLGTTRRPNAKGIAAVLVAVPWRAVLAQCNFAVSFTGGTGALKTSASCLALQHFAPSYVYNRRPTSPASWDSTPAQLEYLAHMCKDTLLVVDDFIASGTQAEQAQTKAAKVLSSQGNGRARGRMRSDMSQQLQDFVPRGAMLTTGEDNVRQKSALGRSLVAKFTPESVETKPNGEKVRHLGSLDLAVLGPLQADAAEGKYARAMSSYIQHVAGDREGTLARLKVLVDEYGEKALAVSEGHARTPGILADLAAGFRMFVEWADTLGALGTTSVDYWCDKHWLWLLSLSDEQVEQQEESDDAVRFVGLVVSALGGQLAYLTDEAGNAPAGREVACGWMNTGTALSPVWSTRSYTATHLGWVLVGKKEEGKKEEEERVYLDINLTEDCVTDLASKRPLSGWPTVLARLAERGWLQVEKASGKTRYRSRKTINKVLRRDLLAFEPTVFWPEV